jgi:hypothetical protein
MSEAPDSNDLVFIVPVTPGLLAKLANEELMEIVLPSIPADKKMALALIYGRSVQEVLDKVANSKNSASMEVISDPSQGTMQ